MPDPTTLPVTMDATEAELFDEAAYLKANPDVAAAVAASGGTSTGRQHWDLHGRAEGRRWRQGLAALMASKQRKLARIKPLLKDPATQLVEERYWDCLSDAQRTQFKIIPTESVSAHGYDGNAMEIVHELADGLILDCGAGRRPVYFPNVVNVEIVPYDTTDVLSVGERLPFKDGVFDAVFSLSVLEHVKDPFACAREIARVLKPGGRLLCCVPFLQPVHAYPHHYYNMTAEGIANLFDGMLVVERNEVPAALHPIFTLTWIIQSWARQLPPELREQFLNMRLEEFNGSPAAMLADPRVKSLPPEAVSELASGNLMWARKPG